MIAIPLATLAVLLGVVLVLMVRGAVGVLRDLAARPDRAAEAKPQADEPA